MIDLIGVYGASGFGREVVPFVAENHPNADIVFIEDNLVADHINDREVWTFEQFTSRPAEHRGAIVAIADPRVRELLDGRCRQAKVELLTVAHPNSVKLDDVTLGDGAILCAFVTITSNVRIGRSFHANIYSYVAHDCVIGDFVTFAPGVMCNGNVRVEDHAYIGTGAVLRQGTREKPLVIGQGAVIGMGAVVTKDVPAGVTVVGNPARELVKN